jgi:hypothetical protein
MFDKNKIENFYFNYIYTMKVYKNMNFIIYAYKRNEIIFIEKILII